MDVVCTHPTVTLFLVNDYHLDLDCGNFDNPFTGLESEGNSCLNNQALPCVGNPAESCGSVDGQFLNIYQKGGRCTFWRTGQFDNVVLATGSWRFIYFYKCIFSMFGKFKGLTNKTVLSVEWSDTVGARALPHNAVDLHPSLPNGNLTIEACVNECEAAGAYITKFQY